jgi:hypothetical protein
MTWILQALAEPLLYRRIALRKSSDVLALAEVFVNFGFAGDSPARWVRSVVIEFDVYRFVDDIGPPDLVSPLTTLVTYATNLVEFELLKRPMPPSVLAVLQYPGRSRLARLGTTLIVGFPSTIAHVSGFRDLQELHLWLPNRGDETLPLIAADASPWAFPRLAELRVHLQDFIGIHAQQLLAFLSRCSFVGLLHFSWINLDWTEAWDAHALTEFLQRNPTITDLRLRVMDSTTDAMAEVLSHTACPRVTVIGTGPEFNLTYNPLSARIQELILDCDLDTESESLDEWVYGGWILLDAILQYHRDTDSLRRIVIAKLTKDGTFGWLDVRKSGAEYLVAGKLATYAPRLRLKGIALLDGYGMELLIQLAPA